MHILNRHTLDRRTVLRAGAAALSLPLLDAMLPSVCGQQSRDLAASLQPRRMVLIHRPLGTYHPHLVPNAAGLKYETTRFLKPFEPYRGKFTLFSGMGHPGYPNDHGTEPAIFTGVPGLNVRDVHNSISLDQIAARHVAGQTRMPYLLLGATWSQSLSWTEKGVPIPHEGDPASLYRRMFVEGTPAEVRREMRRLRQGKSILDNLRGELKSLQSRLGPGDRERIDVLTTSIRDAEQLLAQEQAWSTKPKPVPTMTDADVRENTSNWIAAQEKWLALMHAALQTDSTRVIVLSCREHDKNNVPGLELQHHDASHHGKDPNKVEQLCQYEDREFATYARFVEKLAGTTENGASLLDTTQVLFTSNLGDASAHSSSNLPVLLAGGGFKHQGHVTYGTGVGKPLCNLYVRMLQQFGIEADRFGSSDGVVGEV